VRITRGAAEARRFLLADEALLKDRWIFHYNMACYACKLGDMEEAKGYLNAACKVNPTCRLQALDDPDLEEGWGLFRR